MPKRIYLRNIKKYTIVDDEHFEMLNKYRWRGNKRKGQKVFYVIRSQVYRKPDGTKSYKTIGMHQEILKCTRPFMIDHRNRNPLDNRMVNLRIVTHQQNLLNKDYFNIQRKGRVAKLSKYLGVTMNQNRTKYRASISMNKKCVYLGEFLNEIDAAKAYNEAAVKYRGEFATLNNLKS